jgi:hypothetical protein
LLCSSCGRLRNVMCTSAKKCLLSSPVFKPRPENSDSNEKDTLFGLDTQITIFKIPNPLHFFNCSFSSRPRKCEERNIEQITYRVLLKVVQIF